MHTERGICQIILYQAGELQITDNLRSVYNSDTGISAMIMDLPGGFNAGQSVIQGF